MYITDSTGTREITSWAVPGAGLDVQMKDITREMRSEHLQAQRRNRIISNWTSHTVVVVDQSGSMRKTDVQGGATRSDAVWLTLALDFVAKRIETGVASPSDVVSVLDCWCLGGKCKLVINCEPTNWVLFNTVLGLLRSQEPFFEGNYLPALDMAEELLLDNTNGNCAMTLFFLSDGKPSDQLPRQPTGIQVDPMTRFASLVGERVDSIACHFGRRLTVKAVGFGSADEDFSVLQTIANRSQQFGCDSGFHAANLTALSLSNAFQSLSTSLTMTKTELSGDVTSSQRAVRDVRREARNTRDELQLSVNWLHYPRIVQRVVWDWRTRQWVDIPFFHSSARGAALRTHYFGEGAERLVRKFREVAPDGTFVGPLLVAKESRFQLDVENADLIRFHRNFSATQTRAKDLADVFNDRLLKLQELAGLAADTPRIQFLESSVYVVDDNNLGRVGVLVEKQLDQSRYMKWNDNTGLIYVDGHRSEASHPELDDHQLEAIVELDEEEEEEDTDQNEAVDGALQNSVRINVADIPQAFSHFTFRSTNRRVLVCDLQGVLTSGESSMFEFTDPVIHYNSHTGRSNVFGRTDQGKRGITAFFRTHQCNELCRMLNRRWVRRSETSLMSQEREEELPP